MTSLFDLPFEEPEPEPEPVASEPAQAVPAPAPPLAPSPAATSPAMAAPVQQPRRVLTVSQLTGRIRVLLEEEFVDAWVEGEISNCRLWNTGHLYFTLKDASAQIKAVMFRSTLRYLRFKPQDGLRVVARGRVSVYDPKGEYQ